MTDGVTAYPEVTRFEVIDHRTVLPLEERGIKVHILGADVTVALQDDGRTLKVFLKDRDDGKTVTQIEDEWYAALGHDLRVIMEYYNAARVTRQPGGNTSVA